MMEARKWKILVAMQKYLKRVFDLAGLESKRELGSDG